MCQSEFDIKLSDTQHKYKTKVNFVELVPTSATHGPGTLKSQTSFLYGGPDVTTGARRGTCPGGRPRRHRR